MSKSNGPLQHRDFPRKEEFTDFAGRKRTFTVERVNVPSGGYGIHAVEDVEGDGGYVFREFSAVDPFHALGKLRHRIRRLLSIRHLSEEGGRLSPTHDVVRGRVAYGGVVVDGIFVTFEQFNEMIQTYEGFDFSLKLGDTGDDLA
ncbi:MAG: hypothetical protein RBS80_31030 [Thermoguttaceae bacterium]|jgi:hypothetical protein|nr:hypothetical protein [Thermoguttaceae bacterium]